MARTVCALLAAAVLVACGCAQGPVKADPKVVETLRAQWLLAEAPADPSTPRAVRKALAQPSADPAATPAQDGVVVTLTGVVGGMPNPWPDSEVDFPWRAGRAVFFLVDPAVATLFAGHKHDQAGADCSFCARKAIENSDGVAAVQFVDPRGEPCEVDARELFGLAEGETVIVRGRPSLVGGELLVVEADGLFVRR